MSDVALAAQAMRLLPFCQTCGEFASLRADRCGCGADPHVESAVCGQPGCPCAVPAVRPCGEFHDLGLWPCTGCGWPAREHTA
jgi:hypothetical protein